jgi:uncharacterized protein with PIN domain
MKESKCPHCKNTSFELKRDAVLAHNTPEQKPEFVDFVQCAKCGTVVAGFNLRAHKFPRPRA